MILVAEDDPTSLVVILRQLRLLGHVAEAAPDGAAALALWRAHKHPLVITDLHMPEMSGYDLARAIRREEGPVRRTAVVALTADVLRAEAQQARDAGMDQYLTKPVQLHVLEAAIEEWLSPQAPVNVGRMADQTPRSIQLEPRVDLRVLDALVGTEPGARRDVVATFVEAATQNLSLLGSARRSGSVRELQSVAHRLVGSSKAIGARGLASLAGDLERLASSASTDEGSSLLDEAARVEKELVAVITDLRRFGSSGV